MEQGSCYLEWIVRRAMASRAHQYFSAEADFTCPLMMLVSVRARSPESNGRRAIAASALA